VRHVAKKEVIVEGLGCAGVVLLDVTRGRTAIMARYEDTRSEAGRDNITRSCTSLTGGHWRHRNTRRIGRGTEGMWRIGSILKAGGCKRSI
jgi:hypothetical protein